MDLNDFLHQDIHTAKQETVWVMDCIIKLHHAIRLNDYQVAAVAAENVARSYRELARLNKKKIDQDNMLELVSRMKAAGIDISIIKR